MKRLYDFVPGFPGFSGSLPNALDIHPTPALHLSGFSQAREKNSYEDN